MKRLTLRTSKIYLILSIIAAVLAAGILFACFQNMRSRIAESGNLIRLVVASRDMEAGEVLNPSCLSTVDFPDIYLLPGTFTDPLPVTGKTLRHSLQAGEPLLESALLPPDGGGLAQSSLDEGFRAYPLPSSSVFLPTRELSGGSRVDILAVSGGEAHLILENIEVLGISGPPHPSQSLDESLLTTIESPEECVLLQITAEEACRLAAAQEEGRVEIMLRPAQRP